MVFELYAEPYDTQLNEPLSTTRLTDSEIPIGWTIDEIRNYENEEIVFLFLGICLPFAIMMVWRNML